LLSQVRDVDNMLEDLESQYDVLKADGFVTATDGLKAQVKLHVLLTYVYIPWLNTIVKLACFLAKLIQWKGPGLPLHQTWSGLPNLLAPILITPLNQIPL